MRGVPWYSLAVIRDLWRWGVASVLSVLLLTPACLVALFWRSGARAMQRAWARMMLRVFSIQIEMEKPGFAAFPNRCLYVYINQTSLSESWAILAAFPEFQIILNIEFALIPLIGWGMWLTGGIVVIRQWPAQAKRAVRNAGAWLDRNIPILLSIEGRRSPDGKRSPFKKGPVILALENQVPIVPIYFVGARERLPYGEWRVRPGTIKIYCGPLVDVQGQTLSDRDQILARLHRIAEDYEARFAGGGSSPRA